MTGSGPENWPTRRKPIHGTNRKRFRLTTDSPERDRIRAECEARELARRSAAVELPAGEDHSELRIEIHADDE